MKLRLIVVFLVFANFSCEGSEDVEISRQIVEISKLEAAKGILEGVIRKYEEDLDQSKYFLAIHSHADYVTGGLVWISGNKSGIIAGAFSPRDSANEWAGFRVQADDDFLKRILNTYNICKKRLKNLDENGASDKNPEMIHLDIVFSEHPGGKIVRKNIALSANDSDSLAKAIDDERKTLEQLIKLKYTDINH